MERRQFLRTAALGAAGSAALAAPALAAAPQVKWRWTSSFPRNLTSSYDACVTFTERLRELTDGGFEVQLFGPGELVPALQVLDAVQNGTVEAGFTATYFYVGKDPTFVMGTALPFGLNTRQMAAWIRKGGGRELIQEFLDGYGVHYTPMGMTGAQMGGWYRNPIKSLADMDGLKMRIGGFASEIMRRMGVVPQLIAAGDIYPALERGTIDAVEYVGPFDDQTLGLHKVAKYYHFPGWWEGGLNVGSFVNKDAWAALPPAYKAAWEVAAVEMEANILTTYDKENGPALRELVGKGVELSPFPQDVMSKAYEISFAYYDEIAAQNPAFKKIYDSYIAFRKDALLWFRVGETSYDNFVLAEYSRRKY